MIRQKKTAAYIEFGATGHRPVWIRSVIEAFERIAPGWRLNIWVPAEFVDIHKDWCAPYLSPASMITFRFHEEVVPARTERKGGGPTDFEVIRRCVRADGAVVCFIGNKLDSILRDFAFSRPGVFKSKLVGIMDYPFLHYKMLASPHTRKWLSVRRFIPSYLKNLLVCHRASVGEILMLDPFAPAFYNAVLRTSKYSFLPEYYNQVEPHSEPRAYLNLPLDKSILLFIGPTDARKGIIELLNAMESAYSKDKAFRSRVCFVIAGVVLPETRSKVYESVARVRRLYPDAEIILVDRLLTDREFTTYLHAADVVCIPYIQFHSTSNLLVQAAAAGRPVLSSDFGVVGELVDRYNLGVTCNASDERALRDALFESIDRAHNLDSSARESFRAFARKHAVPLKEFGEEVCKAIIRLPKRADRYPSSIYKGEDRENCTENKTCYQRIPKC